MQTIKKIMLFGMVMVGHIFFAQNQQIPSKTKTEVATKKYDNYAYIDAIKTYEKIAKKGYKSVDLFEKLANSYYYNANLLEANKWYTELFALNQAVAPENYFKYSQTLKAMGDYKKADEMLVKFNVLSGNDKRAQIFDKERNYLQVIKNNSGRFKIKSLDINSDLLDYGTTVLNNKLIFASNRKTKSVAKRKIKWNNQEFTNLYEATIKEDGTVADVKVLSGKVNSPYDESTPVFTNDGKFMYFTRSNSFDEKLGEDTEGKTGLKLYLSKYENDTWSAAEALSINSDQYSIAHPAISPDGKTIYYASNIPGSLGESDLYKSTINSDGTVGKPVNLGPEINTPGRETFPFVSGDNELYFATDARQGLGGLDIFVSRINVDGNFSDPINIGGPINDTTDDFAYYFDSKTRTGFFTSNRATGKGYDDIYSFVETKKLKCDHELNGVITDENTNLPLAAAKVILLDRNMRQIAESITTEKGAYKFVVDCGENYYVRTINQDYDVKEVKVSIPNKSGKTEAPISVGKKVVVLKENDDVFKVLKLQKIYFDLDKSFIREDAALELEKVLDVMQQYPTMIVDVRSHTDSRQSKQYNEALSDRRAKSTVEWLVKNGIAKNRLTGKGYGESQLINNCSDDATCTEEEHQLNRRSEFIIIKM